jgi:hypothetical protein
METTCGVKAGTTTYKEKIVCITLWVDAYRARKSRLFVSLTFY